MSSLDSFWKPQGELARVNSCAVCVCKHCDARATYDGCMIIIVNGTLEKHPYKMQDVKVYQFTNQHDIALRAQEPQQ